MTGTKSQSAAALQPGYAIWIITSTALLLDFFSVIHLNFLSFILIWWNMHTYTQSLPCERILGHAASYSHSLLFSPTHTPISSHTIMHSVILSYIFSHKAYNYTPTYSLMIVYVRQLIGSLFKCSLWLNCFVCATQLCFQQGCKPIRSWNLKHSAFLPFN